MFHVTDMLGQTNDKRGSQQTTGDRYPYLSLNSENLVFVTELDTGKETGHQRYRTAALNTEYEIEVHQIDVNVVYQKWHYSYYFLAGLLGLHTYSVDRHSCRISMLSRYDMCMENYLEGYY